MFTIFFALALFFSSIAVRILRNCSRNSLITHFQGELSDFINLLISFGAFVTFEEVTDLEQRSKECEEEIFHDNRLETLWAKFGLGSLLFY